jgi:hypothetical protein
MTGGTPPSWVDAVGDDGEVGEVEMADDRGGAAGAVDPPPHPEHDAATATARTHDRGDPNLGIDPPASLTTDGASMNLPASHLGAGFEEPA